MQNEIRVNDQLTVAGQPLAEEFRQIAQRGFKSVLNLRSSDEEGFLKVEPQRVEEAGLRYAHIPVKASSINDDLTHRVLQEIRQTPKPALIHCRSGLRSGAMTMMFVALENGLGPQEALRKAGELGFDCSQNEELKAYFENYIARHAKENNGS